MGKPKIVIKAEGGAAAGAEAAGFLFELLKHEKYDVQAVRGTSAGGVNAACMAYGFEEDGAYGARAKLVEFWFHPSLIDTLRDNQWALPRVFETAVSYNPFLAYARPFVRAFEQSSEAPFRLWWESGMAMENPVINVAAQVMPDDAVFARGNAFPVTVNTVRLVKGFPEVRYTSGNRNFSHVRVAQTTSLAPYFAPVDNEVDGIYRANAPLQAGDTQHHILHLVLTKPETAAAYAQPLMTDGPRYSGLVVARREHKRPDYGPHDNVSRVIIPEPAAHRMFEKFFPTPDDVAMRFARGRAAYIEWEKAGGLNGSDFTIRPLPNPNTRWQSVQPAA